MYSILWRIRLIFIPASSAFVVSMLAYMEWSKIFELDQQSATFHKNSHLVTFSPIEPIQENGKTYPVYQYVLKGEFEKFTALRKIPLPPDGKVRIGLDPSFEADRFSDRLPREIVVPIGRKDSIDAVYEEFRGHERKRDLFKAWAVTAASLVVGIAAFFLQKIIFKSLNNSQPRRY